MNIFGWIREKLIAEKKYVFCVKCRTMEATVKLETIPVQSPTGIVHRMIGKCVNFNAETSTWVKGVGGF